MTFSKSALPMRRRDAVLASALELFLEGGYERTSIEQIRRRAGVTNGALFHHFPTKQHIAGALLVQAQAGVADAVEASLRAARGPRSIVGSLSTAGIRWAFEERPALARFALSAGREAIAAVQADLVIELDRFHTVTDKAYARLLESGHVRNIEVPARRPILFGPGEVYVRHNLGHVSVAEARRGSKAIADAAWRAVKASRAG